jgi:hypothetical protein
MSFDLIRITRDQYPGFDQHCATLQRCLDQSSIDSGDKKTREFFMRALKVMREETIPVLLVRDRKTTGTAGPPDRKHAPWKALLKGEGQSAGKQIDAGGNFGIGKGAAFAPSETYTVFYSTIYRSPQTGQEHFLAQGRTRLISHTDVDGQDVRADGYWGIAEKFMPVETQSLVPYWLHRDDVGTTVAIAGFREKQDWQWELAMSLIMNFFVAVERQEIVFKINDGEILIDHTKIKDLFNNAELDRIRDAKRLTEEFEFAWEKSACACCCETVSIKK